MATLAAPNVYQVQLPMFEGPFDLLLFFIEIDEVDIHDIPISTITKDFLDYIHTLEAMNMEVASEFILVAATLMKIKAKMLLPRIDVNQDGKADDPRSELVNRLLEYKKYKGSLDELRDMEAEMDARFKRGYVKVEEKELLRSDFPEEELVGMDLYTVMKAFRRVWSKHQNRMETPRHVIRKYPYTLDQVKETLMTRIDAGRKVDFINLIMEVPERIYVVFAFLAILELVQQKKAEVVIGKGYNNFWMKAPQAA